MKSYVYNVQIGATNSRIRNFNKNFPRMRDHRYWNRNTLNFLFLRSELNCVHFVNNS